MLITKPVRGSTPNPTHPFSRWLLACWVMSEAVGGIVSDLSGRKNNGRIVNSDYVWAGDQKYGSAVNFGNAAQTYFQLDTVITSLTYDQPCTLIIRARGSGGIDRGLVGSNLPSALQNYLELREGFYIRHRYGSGAQTGFTSVTSFTDWHTFAITSDGGGIGNCSLNLYQDGILKETQAGKNFMFTHLDRIGGAYSTDICNADISYIMILTAELSAADIRTLTWDPFAMFAPSRVIFVVPAVTVAAGSRHIGFKHIEGADRLRGPLRVG